MRVVLLMIGSILLLDQVTKAFVVSQMVLHQSEPIIESFLHLTYVRNPGAAFGFLSRTPAWFRQPSFFAATVVAVLVLGILLRNAAETDRLTSVAVAAILGGVFGNLIDRLRDGSVIDFLDVQWYEYHWPAFNVADTAILLGVMGFVASVLCRVK